MALSSQSQSQSEEIEIIHSLLVCMSVCQLWTLLTLYLLSAARPLSSATMQCNGCVVCALFLSVISALSHIHSVSALFSSPFSSLFCLSHPPSASLASLHSLQSIVTLPAMQQQYSGSMRRPVRPQPSLLLSLFPLSLPFTSIFLVSVSVFVSLACSRAILTQMFIDFLSYAPGQARLCNQPASFL